MPIIDKYDRQLRLWGPRGQKDLSDSRICLLGANATGSETLKNLVLPGIGKFIIVDDTLVNETDVSSNFFVNREKIGANRAEVVRDLLLELNPDVKGEAIISDPIVFIESKSRHKNEFSLLVVSCFAEQDAVRVSRKCEKLDLPFLLVRSYGMIGYLRVHASEICIVESKPSPKPMEDIRIANPFVELEEFVDSINFDSLDDRDFMHLPYVLVLVKLAKEWAMSHGGKLPSNLAEKGEFRKGIKSLARRKWGEEGNLVEALDQAYLAFGPRPTPLDVKEVLDDPRLSDEIFEITEGTKSFWILAKALKRFTENHQNLLPVSGRLPDMTASTNVYTRLQEIYNSKATRDMEVLASYVGDILAAAGRPITQVSKEECELFSKNARDIQVRRFRSLSNELNPASANREAMMMATMDGVGDASDQCPLLWYFTLRACDKFQQLHGRFPGESDDSNFDLDAKEVFNFVEQLLKELDFHASVSIEHAREMTRYGATEIHNTAAMIGGVASQEAVKLITKQYTPMNNTMIYNGIACSAELSRCFIPHKGYLAYAKYLDLLLDLHFA